MSLLTEATVAGAGSRTRERVAPWLHTVFIVGVLVVWVAMSAMRTSMGLVSDAPRWLRYSGQVMVLWLMTGTTVAGLYHRRRFLRGALGGPAFSMRELGVGAGVFVAGVIVLAVVGVALRPLHLTHLQQTVTALAPHTAAELVLWMVVSASAGVCEEFIFRGYLLRQVLSWSGSNWVAVITTSALFAGMHLYEGTAAAIQIGFLGALFATVAVTTGSLRQVMIAHFLQDAIAGLALYLHH